MTPNDLNDLYYPLATSTTMFEQCSIIYFNI